MPRPIPRDDTAAADDFGVPPTAPLPPPPYPSELAAGGSPPQHAEGFADGLITLGHAAEHAAGTLMDAPRAAGAAGEAHASTSGKKAGRKRKRSESLQLELNEDDVIAELYARGLVTENPSEDPKAFKGGRPPLGMGPLKRVKTLYTSRKLTMEDWRMFYAEKCRQNGYSGSFRKDLRPRFYVSKPPPTALAVPGTCRGVTRRSACRRPVARVGAGGDAADDRRRLGARRRQNRSQLPRLA